VRHLVFIWWKARKLLYPSLKKLYLSSLRAVFYFQYAPWGIMVSYPDFLLDEKLQHLPPHKRQELELATKIIFKGFRQELSNRTQKNRRDGRILKLVLFGSYARGNWVEDPVGGYFSDFDLLIVVDKPNFADPEYWWRTEERLIEERQGTGDIETRVELVVESYANINSKIAQGIPFFVDILRDGIVLYETEKHPFSKPGQMTKEEKQAEAKKYFKEYHELSQSGLDGANFHFKKSQVHMDAAMRDAAFMAHQATERIYHCLLLTLTLYSPKEHNLKTLRSWAEGIAPELVSIWPRKTKRDRRAFERLRRAYVDARYSSEYEITREELEWLFERIILLQNKVKEICEAHLK